MKRPENSEYEAYYRLYVGQVPDGDILDTLASSSRQTAELLIDLEAERKDHRYAPGKWTLGEVLGHMIDTEWVFAFRALAIARGETADLPAMDQDAWAAASDLGGRTLVGLADDLVGVRLATLSLFASFDPAVYRSSGRASGFPFTVRTFPWIIAGHEIHHRQVIKERYLDD